MGIFDKLIGSISNGVKSGGFGKIFDWYHDNGIIPNIWKGVTGQFSQEKINDENLQYQRERNAIEDARYEEETAYNRAFAEEERDYNRAFAEDERAYQRNWAQDERAYQRDWALNEREYQRNLQQTIFDREDTAIARQADALRAQGINPASQNMNGLGAGSVVSSSAPGSSAPGSSGAPSSMSAPALSGRGGQALQKAMITSSGINGLLTPILQTLNTIDTLKGNGIQRDVLNAQAVKTQAEANIAVMNMFDTANRLNQPNNSFYYGVNKNKKYNFKVDDNSYNPYFYSPQLLNNIEGKTKYNQYVTSNFDANVAKLQEKRLDSIGDAMSFLTGKLKNQGADEKVMNSFSSIIESLLLKAFK